VLRRSRESAQLYLTPVPSEVIAGVLAHHRRMSGDDSAIAMRDEPGAGEYRAETLDTLFGRRSS
jgi:hypothetical protein